MDLLEFAIFRTKKQTHLRHNFPEKKKNMAATSTGPTSHSIGFIDFYWKKCSDEHLGCADPLASIKSHWEILWIHGPGPS